MQTKCITVLSMKPTEARLCPNTVSTFPTLCISKRLKIASIGCNPGRTIWQIWDRWALLKTVKLQIDNDKRSNLCHVVQAKVQHLSVVFVLHAHLTLLPWNVAQSQLLVHQWVSASFIVVALLLLICTALRTLQATVQFFTVEASHVAVACMCACASFIDVRLPNMVLQNHLSFGHRFPLLLNNCCSESNF